jgi:hypothetical protein
LAEHPNIKSHMDFTILRIQYIKRISSSPNESN